jgi:Beta-propeller repeat
MPRMILRVAVLVLVIGVKPVWAQRYGNLPLAFEPNQGQSDSRVKFLSRGGGYTVFLTETGAVLTLQDAAGSTIRASLIGAAPARVDGTDPLVGHTNYIIGKDPRRWQMGVPQFGRVRYDGIYPGIDLLFYGNQRQLEYDFIVSPHRQPSSIRLAIDGAKSVRLDSNGDLVLGTRGRPIRMQRPIAYQHIGGTRRPVDVRYRLTRGHTVGFDVGPYDSNAALVIDPLVLVSSSYLGGFGWDEPNDMALDTAGNAYVTGLTEGRGFPVTAGGQLSPSVSSVNAFVTKIDPSGSLVYSTIFGGSSFENPFAIAVDASGAAVVAGGTGSADFPAVGGLQTDLRGPEDAFVVKLSPSGTSLVYSALFGGSSHDEFTDLVVAASGEVYVAGTTMSVDLPVRNAMQPSFGGGTFDMFVVKLNADASEVLYATYLGGSRDESFPSLTVDSAGSAFIVGATRSFDFPTANALQPTYHAEVSAGFYPDAFVTKLTPNGSSLVYSTFLGGAYSDYAADVAVDASGNAYVVGSTDSGDFPRVGGIPRTNYYAYPDAFVTKIDSTGSAIVFSTTLGGSSYDSAGRIALDASSNVWIAGGTSSADFPVKSPFQPAFAGGWDDGYVAKLSPQGSSLLASTYFGGSGRDYISGFAIDGAGSVIVAGVTSSPDLPTLNPFQAALAATPDQQGSQSGQDGFLAKLAWQPDPVLTANAGPDLIVPANDSCQGEVTLDGTRSTAPPGRYLSAYVWVPRWPLHGYAEGPRPTFKLPSFGTYTVDLTVYDDLWNRATDSVDVTLADLEGPRVGSLTATPAVIWPPNREMIPVTVTVADVSDACSGPVTCRIDSVTSNEALAPGDWVITGALTVQLRADRVGDGTGRIYTIAITCTDAAGKSTRKTVTVLVPHDV